MKFADKAGTNDKPTVLIHILYLNVSYIPFLIRIFFTSLNLVDERI